MADEDPTCIVEMINDLGRTSANSRASHLFHTRRRTDVRNNTNSAFGAVPTAAVADSSLSSCFSTAKKLNFDESGSDLEISAKKRKFIDEKSSIGETHLASPWEMRRLKGEVLEARARIISLESTISKVHTLRKETGLVYEQQIEEHRNNLNIERKKVRDLEDHLREVRKRESELRDQLSDSRCFINDNCGKLNDKITELEMENQLLRNELDHLKAGNEVFNMMLKDENHTKLLQAELDSLKRQLDMDKNLIDLLNADLTKKNENIDAMKLELCNLSNAQKLIRDLEYEKETFLETRAYVESQSNKLFHYHDLEKEVAELKDETKRLKSAITNTLQLESEVDGYKTRIATMDRIQEDKIRLETENGHLKSQLEHWNNLTHYCTAEDVKSKKIPFFVLVQRRLDELLKKELLLFSEKNQLEIENHHLKEKCENLENQYEETQQEVTRLNGSCETLNTNIRRLKKQLQLITWERNDLRNLLDSWQKEATFISDGTTNQIDVLQKAIDGYKERTKQIEIDPSTFSVNYGIDKTNSSEYEELLRKSLKLERDNEKLLFKIQNLNEQIEYRAFKGDYDPRTTQIVHMKLNPTAESLQNYDDKLSKANEEVIKLRERVKVLLEEGNVADITKIVEDRVQNNISKEVEKLNHQLKSQQIQNQRLCEIFKKQSQEFRDAIYMMLGYKVDSKPNAQYRLSSMYAENPGDILLFKISKTGNMEMIETSYTQTLGDLIDLYLKQQHSIPLFLSSLTVELFNKQTMLASSSSSMSQEEITIISD